MKPRLPTLIGRLCLTATLLTASSALASGPPGTDVPIGYGFCKSGPNKGAACNLHSTCDSSYPPKHLCVVEYLKGQGSTLRGTLTVIIDDHLTDLCPQSPFWSTHCLSDSPLLNRRAAGLILEFKHKGQVHVLSNLYQDNNPADPPWLYFGTAEGVTEDNLPTIDGLEDRCESWIPTHRQPSPAMAFALQNITGINGRPIIVDAKFKGPTDSPQNGGNNGFASIMRCKVKIRFMDAPILWYPQS